MTYVLGIDLGTSYTGAAVGHADGRVDMFQLGQRAAAIPSLVVVRADGEVLTGEAAERRALTEPGRTAREFKRRLGDPVPFILGSTPYGPDALLAILLRAVARQVAEQLGGPPGHVVITHPAAYGPYKLDLLRQAARQADLGAATFVSEPVAAAIHYARLEQVPDGSTIAVYDFGGGTFDATVLRKSGGGFTSLGTPEGLERLGGVDFDEAIFRHVVRAIGAPAASLDAGDPAVAAGLARLRDECRRAKEALSADSDVAIPVSLPGIQTEVRLTRAEFEAMIEPRIAETIAALVRAASSAGVPVAEVDRILFVGGTSRIPRIAERVHAATGRPIKVDVHPKHSVALGAARLGVGELTSAEPAGLAATAADPAMQDAVAAEATPVTSTVATPPEPKATAASATGSPSTGGVAGSAAQRRPASPRGQSNRAWLFPGLAAAAAFLAIGAILASGVLDGASAGASTSPTTAIAGAPSLPPAPSALPTFATGVRAEVTGVRLVDGRYAVAFETTGFAPSMGGQHVHFFWNTVPPDEAGEPAGGPYAAYAGASPFTGFAPATRPDGATAICITAANVDHSVVSGTGSCAAIP